MVETIKFILKNCYLIVILKTKIATRENKLYHN